MAVDQDLDGQDDDVAVRFLICEIDVATTLCVLSFANRLTVNNSRFVIPEGLDETSVSDALSEAFNLCSEADMAPAWVEEASVLNVSPTKTVTFIHGELVSVTSKLLASSEFLLQDVFVMDPFTGPAFDHLTSDSKFRCTVVGPRCLLSCLK